jgi:hypothetical protein
VIEEIFARFCEAEFHADWDAGVAQWGDRMVSNMLERTDAQRRFDALLAVFTSAAASGAVGQFDPLVNLNLDQTTFEYHPAKLAGTNPAPLDPATVDQRRCQTDHTTSWATSGPTRPDNGGIACARHNRWKQHGYRTWRDPNGHWHTYRPDGTEIGCLSATIAEGPV